MTATVTGYDEAIEALRQLDVAVRARIVRRAVKDVVSEAAREMKAAAPQRADAGRRAKQRLRQRLGDMVRTYRDGALTFAMAGERSYTRGQRHAHLVEHGHRIVTGGTIEHRRTVVNKLTGEVGYRTYVPRGVKAERRGRGQVKGRTTPRPFMGAIIAKYVTAAPEKLRASLAERIMAEAARLANG